MLKGSDGKNWVHRDMGVNPPTTTWLRTLQEISQDESLTLCFFLWEYFLLLFLSFFFFFFLSLSVATVASDKTNKSYPHISCPYAWSLYSPPPPFPMNSPFFMMYFSPLVELCLLASWPFLFCQSPPTIAWQIADREADILSLRGLDLVKITFIWNNFSHLSKFLPRKYK